MKQNHCLTVWEGKVAPTLRASYSCGLWIVFNVFLFGLPGWANHFNDTKDYFNSKTPWNNTVKNGAQNYLCATSVDDMPCANGQNFAELARHRIALSGRRDVACGCGQGVFGESLCPMDPMGYSVSSFISTGPAGGLFSGLAYSTFSGNFHALRLSFSMVDDKYKYWYSLPMFWINVAFVVVFGLFIFASDCVFLKLHQFTTTTWFTLLMLNDLGLMFSLCPCVRKSTEGAFTGLIWLESAIIGFGSIAGILTFTVFSVHIPQTPDILDKIPYSFPPDRVYYFFFGECLAISTMFLVGPMHYMYIKLAHLAQSKNAVTPEGLRERMLSVQSESSVN